MASLYHHSLGQAPKKAGKRSIQRITSRWTKAPEERRARNTNRICLTGIYIGFDFSDLGLIYFCDRGHVGILSFLGFERIRTLVEETLLDTISNEVMICLRPFDRMIVLAEVYLELGYICRVWLGERPDDGRS
jgi:hypothetical protein